MHYGTHCVSIKNMKRVKLLHEAFKALKDEMEARHIKPSPR